MFIKYELVESFTETLNDGGDVVAEDEVVDEVDDELSEDDGELVPADEHAADAGGSDLADIHRADGGGEAHTDTADDAVDVEDDEEGHRGLTLGEDHGLGAHRSPGADEEEDACEDEGALTAEARGEHTAEGATDDAADECARRREAVHEVGVLEVLGAHEERLESLFGTADDGRVVTEEQAADDGDEDN